MSQVLYRKYRSKSLNELVGQEHITKTLSEALKSDRISHAYLFTGPKGVGKTSVARILAHEINGLPYTDDQPHIDIIEIDAASNRRIDEIRDLREKVHTLPASAKYKVYIIDEVHMLTKEAFNALLKTLEEPPAHVIFILATTDPQKLPDTIISRTQHFSFRPIDAIAVVAHLRSIANKEKIKINDEALELIAEHGEGSFRDSISLLDQLGHGPNQVTADEVRSSLGIPPSSAINKLVSSIDNPNSSYKDISFQLQQLNHQGFTSPAVAKLLMNELRDRLVEQKLAMSKDQAISLLKELLNVDSSSDQNAYLLLSLINVVGGNRPPVAKPPLIEDIKAEEAPVAIPDIPEKAAQSLDEASTKKESVNTGSAKTDEELWPLLLNELKDRYNTLYGIIRMAQPVFSKDNQLELIFEFAFHKKRISEAKNTQIITSIIKELTGQSYHITSTLGESGPKPEASQTEPSTETKDLDNVAKIFGGGELVD